MWRVAEKSKSQRTITSLGSGIYWDRVYQLKQQFYQIFSSSLHPSLAKTHFLPHFLQIMKEIDQPNRQLLHLLRFSDS